MRTRLINSTLQARLLSLIIGTNGFLSINHPKPTRQTGSNLLGPGREATRTAAIFPIILLDNFGPDACLDNYKQSLDQSMPSEI